MAWMSSLVVLCESTMECSRGSLHDVVWRGSCVRRRLLGISQHVEIEPMTDLTLTKHVREMQGGSVASTKTHDNKPKCGCILKSIDNKRSSLFDLCTIVLFFKLSMCDSSLMCDIPNNYIRTRAPLPSPCKMHV